MKLECRPLAPAEYEEWDRQVFLCPRATLFHSTLWLGASAQPFAIYGVFDDRELIGGYGLHIGASGGGNTSARAWLTPYAGHVTFANHGKHSAATTIEKAVGAASAKRLRQDFAKVKTRLCPFANDIQAYLWAGFTPGVRYTYLVDVSSEAANWSNLDENHRRNIRKAQRAPFCVDETISLDDCLGLFRATRENPDKCRSLLHSYRRCLSLHKRDRLIAVRDGEGRALAAVYIVWDDHRGYYLLGGYEEDGPNANQARIASTYGIWESMRFVREELGLATFDLEGSMIPGVELFFRKFGGELRPYFTVEWSRPSGWNANAMRYAAGYAARLARLMPRIR